MERKTAGSKAFLLNARQAAKLEQDQMYQEAAIWWRKAATYVNGTARLNTQWASDRAEFCTYWPTRDISLKEKQHEAQ